MPALSSGVVPDGQLMPFPPPEQSRESSALQPAGTTKLPLLPLLLPALAVVEQPSSAPELPPPTAAMATVNSNPLTVFQP